MSIQRQKAQDKNIDFQVEFQGISLSESNESFESSPIVNCDEHRIMQVLLGLQSNALKFTQKGQVFTKVQIITVNLEEFLKIQVTDTGIGIAKKDQDKLFKLFGFVQDEKQMNINGIGLGLMISKLIVEKFDGSIAFKSKKNIGS